MPLNNLITPGPWAITPEAIESLRLALREMSSPAALESLAKSNFAGADEATSYQYQLEGAVAIIEVQGTIARRGGQFMWFSWAGQDTIKSAIEAALADASAKAILLSFDSPGGVAAGVKELADYIAGQTAKPIYAYADGLCASAAFWLAAATGRVYAPVTAMVGSIGVIQVHCDQSGANAASGLRYTYITGGTWKAAGNSGAPLVGAELAYLQSTIGKLHDIFKSDVATHLNLKADDCLAWGDGQIFIAAEAQQLGLVSGLVESRQTLIAQINKEMNMDKAQLAEKHPELLAQITTEIKAETKVELQLELQLESKQNQETHQALVALVAGKEVAAQVATLAAIGLTLDQVNVLGPHLIKPQTAPSLEATTDNTAMESSSRQAILTAIKDATSGPIALGQLSPTSPDSVPSAIDRISAL